MPQFFVDKEFDAGDEVEIRGADAHHISDVLRLKSGDWLLLSDGRGRSFRSIIVSISSRKVALSIEEEIRRIKAHRPPVLALAMIKGDRFEWALQKSVEIGCERILPFFSARSVPQFSRSILPKKIERWRRIAIEAAKQSGLPNRPTVEVPCDFTELLEMSEDFEHTIIFFEGEKTRSIRSIIKSAVPEGADLLIIGPEGGFDSDEIAKAKASGATTASLGRQILRVETAAIAALAIWQYELGNMEA